MFLGEALGFLNYFVEFFAVSFTALLEMGVMSLLVFGPITGLLVSAWSFMGLGFFPLACLLALFMMDLFWILKLPFVMIEYNPSIPQFVVVYFTIISVMLLFTNLVLKLFFATRDVSQKTVAAGRRVAIVDTAQ
jgi:hypothetical protein